MRTWSQHKKKPHAKRPLPGESLEPITGLRGLRSLRALSPLCQWVGAQGDAALRCQVRCIRRHVLHGQGDRRKERLTANRCTSPMSQATVLAPEFPALHRTSGQNLLLRLSQATPLKPCLDDGSRARCAMGSIYTVNQGSFAVAQFCCRTANSSFQWASRVAAFTSSN